MKNLLLLHGALGSQKQFSELKKALVTDFNVLSPDLIGHGSEPLTEDFSIQGFCDQVLRLLDANQIASTGVFGYSMGGYVALKMADLWPDRISSVFTFATKLEWSPEIAQRETAMLDPEKVSQKIPTFAQLLKDRHSATNWQTLMRKTSGLLESLGNQPIITSESLSATRQPVMFGIGDRDNMVTLQETIEAKESTPNSHLSVHPNTPHPFEKIELPRLLLDIRRFFA